MHKHQMKPAAVDDNIQAPTGKISHNSKKKMVEPSQKQQWRTAEILKNLGKWCETYCNTNQHLIWKLRHSQEIY